MAMDYDFRSIEARWKQVWSEQDAYKVTEDPGKPKFYVLDMFPYPSGAGLHVGHPLGYIASDIFARYMRHRGYNVLHPMGYDSFGLPAEQYAIQTGQHPAVTTEANIQRYREQMDLLGFSFDWSREVRTSDPKYYRWTQWIFGELFESWYDRSSNQARPIAELRAAFSENGTFSVQPFCDRDWWKELDKAAFAPLFGDHFAGDFTAVDWQSMTAPQQEWILMHFRIAYLADSEVNWCPALGTVLANDEVKDGLSERGGHPVEKKRMRQWIMRISAYADRLLSGLNEIDWTDSIKEAQRNWIGRSEGAAVRFDVDGLADAAIEVFTTRPDTIHGVSFMVLAPEHPLVSRITTDEQSDAVAEYIRAAALKSERERQGAGEQAVTGCFTGGHAIHPFTGERLPIWIADYVLAGYGTGAVMAVPAGDDRDWRFAQAFDLPIPNIFENADLSEGACTSKSAVLQGSGELNGMTAEKGIPAAIAQLETAHKGWGKVTFRLRDAVFSRQRYWGEPFPICYIDDLPVRITDEQVTLPSVDAYLPTADGEPPLARAERTDWPVHRGDRMETNTMPGWAGSSWYFLRYMDPHNDQTFCAPEKSDYWGQVDLYVGGAEHTTGHLLYARFWTKFLFDRGWIRFDEPFKKMVNQGMILGRSSFVYRIQGTNTFVSKELKNKHKTQRLHVDINLVENDVLNTEGFKAWRAEFADADFLFNENGEYICGHEVEKMSKSKFNVQTPDELVERFGADTVRCYEMFLGPLTQHKPWDTQGISGVHNFLRKFARLYANVSNEPASEEALRILHKTIAKVTDDLERHAFNTVISALMIAVNELTECKCHAADVLRPMAILLSPQAPHLAEELHARSGGIGSVLDAVWPEAEEKWLKADQIQYPVSFNGKVRFQFQTSADTSPADVETAILSDERTKKQIEGKTIRKVIVVPGRIVNVVC